MTSFLPGSFASFLQQLLAMADIFVAENLDGCPREARAVDDAGVVELVGEDEVLFAQNRAHGAGVGRKSALEDHAGFDILEAGDLFFELHVDAHGSRDGAHRSRAHAKGARGVDRCLDEPGMIGEAEIVVAGQVDDFAAVVMADRGLLVVENAKLEVGALGAEVIEDLGQMGKLRASRCLGHRNAPQSKSIARSGARDSHS